MSLILQEELALDYTAKIDGDKWSSVAYIPAEYFPAKVDSFNAYAIHGSGDERMYEALNPVPQDKFTSPDLYVPNVLHEELFDFRFDKVHTSRFSVSCVLTMEMLYMCILLNISPHIIVIRHTLK